MQDDQILMRLSVASKMLLDAMTIIADIQIAMRTDDPPGEVGEETDGATCDHPTDKRQDVSCMGNNQYRCLVCDAIVSEEEG